MDEEITSSLKSDRLFRALSRIWSAQPDKGGSFLGTAFFVAPRYAMTAAHVVREADLKKLTLHLSWLGGFYAPVLHIHAADERTDAALLEIGEEAAAPTESIVTVGETLPLTVGTPLRIAGFADTGSSAEIRPAAATGLDARTNAIIIDPPPARGMSGGPALSPDGLLRGMIWARDQDKGRGYLTPVSALRPLLAQAEMASDATPARMLEYPALTEDRKRLARARTMLLRWRELYGGRREELEEGARQARALQYSGITLTSKDALQLVELASSVADAMKTLPIDELDFATHYGLQVHNSIFAGMAFYIIRSAVTRYRLDQKIDTDDRYAFENMARVLESAIALLDFRPDALPQGFVEPTIPIDMSAVRRSNDFVLARSHDERELKLVATRPEPRVVGALVARSLSLNVEAARKMADGTVEVLASDFHHRYRWSTAAARPSAQFLHHSALFAAFPSATPGSSPVIGGFDGSLRELYLDGESNELLAGDRDGKWVAGAIWRDPDENEATYLLHVSAEGLMRTIRLGSEELVQRDFAEARSDPEYSEFTSGLSPLDTSIEMVDLEGFPCAFVTAHMPRWTSFLFVDPKSLAPIKPMRRIGPILHAAIAVGRWLIVSHYGVHEGEPLLTVYDLSSARDGIAGELKHAGEDVADATGLSVRMTGRHSFDAFFIRHLLHPISGHRFCRWSWPNGLLEELLQVSAETIFAVEE